MEIGYTMMCEQSGPNELVSDGLAAEEAGFDFSVISDHYFPWVDARATPPTPGRPGSCRPGHGPVPLMTS